MQSIDLIETYAYGMNKDLVFKKEEINCNFDYNFDYRGSFADSNGIYFVV